MEVSEFIIYAIKNPSNGQVLYVGQSSKWLLRPRIHLKHPAKNGLLKAKIEEMRISGIEPVIEVLESVEQKHDLLERETFWINHMISAGHQLCNLKFSGKYPSSVPRFPEGKSDLSKTIKKIRQEHKMTQPQFAVFVGIGLKTIRAIEQGKNNVKIDSLLKIFNKTQHTITITKL